MLPPSSLQQQQHQQHSLAYLDRSIAHIGLAIDVLLCLCWSTQPIKHCALPLSQPMQDLAKPDWHWPTDLINMVAATDHDFPPDPARGPAVQSSSSKTRGPTPMHRDCKLKPDDQGICTSEDGQLWPVVVLRDDMVPDMLRPAEPPASEGKVPVLFFGSMDV